MYLSTLSGLNLITLLLFRKIRPIEFMHFRRAKGTGDQNESDTGGSDLGPCRRFDLNLF